MNSNFPDYNRISEIANKLQELDEAEYWNEEAYNLERELEELIIGQPVEVAGKSCGEKYCHKFVRNTKVYYPGKVHHLDGNTNNESFGNLAMVCPNCRSHILLSRYSPEDIWLLRTRGLNNARIGKLLDISRERVRQLFNKSQSYQEDVRIKELVKLAKSKKRTEEEESRLKSWLDGLVSRAQEQEKSLPSRYKYYKDGDGTLISTGVKRRLTDKRTLRKCIIAALVKPGTKP